MKFTNKFLPWTAIAVVCLACTASPLMASMDMYLNIPGIKGDTTAKGFQNQVTVNSMSWGLSNPVTFGSGAPSSGKPSLSSLNLMMVMDSSSVPLTFNCAQGAQLQDPVVLTFTKPATSGAPLAFYTITLSNVYVISVQISASTGGDNAPTESMSLSFGSIQWSYTPYNSSGVPGTPIVHSWDIVSNSGN